MAISLHPDHRAPKEVKASTQRHAPEGTAVMLRKSLSRAALDWGTYTEVANHRKTLRHKNCPSNAHSLLQEPSEPRCEVGAGPQHFLRAPPSVAHA